VPTECGTTLAAATRSATAPEQSTGALRSRRASPGTGSVRRIHRAPAPGSSSTDGSPVSALRLQCMKTVRPDPQMPRPCQPPPIRDKKLNRDALTAARDFQQTARAATPHRDCPAGIQVSIKRLAFQGGQAPGGFCPCGGSSPPCRASALRLQQRNLAYL